MSWKYHMLPLIILVINNSKAEDTRLLSPEDKIKSQIKASLNAYRKDNKHQLFFHETGAFSETRPKQSKQPENNIRKNIFVTVKTNKTTCYVGEAINVTYKLYSSLNSKLRITRQPSFKGFAVGTLLENIPLHAITENVGGEKFEVLTVKKLYLIPFQTGRLELDPIELESTSYSIKNTFGSQTKNDLKNVIEQALKEEAAPAIKVITRIISKPVVITVDALPELNQPVDFSGAIGQFTISSNAVLNSSAHNHVGLLNVELKGHGYLPLINAPLIKWPLNLDHFDVSSVELADSVNSLPGGRKTFHYKFIASRAGRYTIPPVSFSYFDPMTEMYRTIETRATAFEVKANDTGLASQPSTNRANAVSAIEITGVTKRNTVFKQVMTILLFLGLIIACFKKFVKRRVSSAQKQITSILSLKYKSLVEETIQDPFETARPLLTNASVMEFYKELNSILWDNINNKLNMQHGELNKTNIAIKFKNKGWNDEMIKNLDAMLTECEQNIYIPGFQTRIDPETQLKMAEKIVIDIKKL